MKKGIIILLVIILAAVVGFSAFTALATETVTNTQMLNYCGDCDSYISTYGKTPSSVGPQITAAEFYYMMSRWLRWYKTHSNTPPATVSIIRGTLGPPNPSGTESGTIQLADILTKGESNANFIDTNSQLPNYSTVGSTQYSTKAMFWVFSRTMQWYRDNGSMPTYATVYGVNPPDSWVGGPTITPTPIITPTMGPTPTNHVSPYQIVVTSQMVSSVAKCTCGSYPYVYQAHAFVNHCPYCDKYGTIAHVKSTIDGEWTCAMSKGGCDMDFCMQCGKEKISGSQRRLTKIY